MERYIQQMNRRNWMASVLAAAGGIVMAGAEESWRPVFLSASDNQNLLAIGERIVPGTAAAQSNRVIDLVLNIESPATQTGFREALRAFVDAGFLPLAPQRQDALLARASTAGDPLHQPFLFLKEWLADAYWTSPAGMRELGFDNQMAWPEFNPCPHPA